MRQTGARDGVLSGAQARAGLVCLAGSSPLRGQTCTRIMLYRAGGRIEPMPASRGVFDYPRCVCAAKRRRSCKMAGRLFKFAAQYSPSGCVIRIDIACSKVHYRPENLVPDLFL